MTAPENYLFPMDSNADRVGVHCLVRTHRKPSPKQSKVLTYVRQNGQITIQQAVELIGTDIYANACKHVGATLSNMVKRGMLARVKKGVFCLPNEKDHS